jgi:hypothetical protein
MSLFSSLADSFSTPTPTQGPRKPSNDLAPGSLDVTSGSGTYENNPANWYSAKPYGFRYNTRTGDQFVMFLPISPSNITITTNFAVNIIPTLYGTVEEHSDIRYYEIVIEGTTGIAPQFVSPSYNGPSSSNNDSVAYANLKEPGRARFPINSNVALGGFLSSTVSQVSNLLNQANKAVSAIGGLFGSNSPKPETALYTDQTGYVAFHNLYRFLKRYKQNAAGLNVQGIPGLPAAPTHPLTFFNYKDGNEYDVAIRSFTMRKSADNPMLYSYSIVMRGYNLRTSGSSLPTDDLTQRLSDLGLSGVKSSTLFSSIKGATNAAKAVVGGAANGINLFGR